jgi:hypothetical protein
MCCHSYVLSTLQRRVGIGFSLAVVQESLLQRAGSAGKRIVGVRTNQPYRADHNDEDRGQHDGIFGNVLTSIV